jgi:hypothetical protein
MKRNTKIQNRKIDTAGFKPTGDTIARFLKILMKEVQNEGPLLNGQTTRANASVQRPDDPESDP